MHHKIKQTFHFHFIATLFFYVHLIHLADQLHQPFIPIHRIVCEPDESFSRKIILKQPDRYLQYNRLVRLWRMHGMNFVGIHDHKFSLHKRIRLLFDIETKFPLTDRKNLHRTMPVHLTLIIAILALKNKHLEGQPLIRHDQLMIVLHFSLLYRPNSSNNFC